MIHGEETNEENAVEAQKGLAVGEEEEERKNAHRS